MRNVTTKEPRLIAYINGRFIQKLGSNTIDLGTTLTRKGMLTRQQKLKIIDAGGEFVEI